MTLEPLDQVVLIDDDSLDNKHHSRIIQKTGLARDIKVFTLAQDALAWFRKSEDEAVDLIFLDVNMPRMDGFELLEAIRDEFGDRFERLIVVMLTTSLDETDRERAARFPVIRDYIQKSLTREDFEKLVRQINEDRIRKPA